MSKQLPNATGMLILRLWVEGNTLTGLRARITQTLDGTGGERSVATAATAEDIYAVVRRWVETFVNDN
ncbi:MAG: hypothetical protein ACXVD9_05045 [Actinomycetota bacterium]